MSAHCSTRTLHLRGAARPATPPLNTQTFDLANVAVFTFFSLFFEEPCFSSGKQQQQRRFHDDDEDDHEPEDDDEGENDNNDIGSQTVAAEAPRAKPTEWVDV